MMYTDNLLSELFCIGLAKNQKKLPISQNFTAVDYVKNSDACRWRLIGTSLSNIIKESLFLNWLI